MIYDLELPWQLDAVKLSPVTSQVVKQQTNQSFKSHQFRDDKNGTGC
jgi:hypothetical protein